MPKITKDNQKLAARHYMPYVVPKPIACSSTSVWQPVPFHQFELSNSLSSLPPPEIIDHTGQINNEAFVHTFLDSKYWSVINTVDVTDATPTEAPELKSTLPASLLQSSEMVLRAESCRAWKEQHVDVAFRKINFMLKEHTLTQEHARAFLEELIKGMLIIHECRPTYVQFLFERFQMQIDYFEQQKYNCPKTDAVSSYLVKELKSILAFFSYQCDIMRFGVFLQTHFPEKFDALYTRPYAEDQGIHGEVIFAREFKRLKTNLADLFSFDSKNIVTSSSRRYIKARDRAIQSIKLIQEETFVHLGKIIDQAFRIVPLQFIDDNSLLTYLECYLLKVETMRGKINDNKPIVGAPLEAARRIISDSYFDAIKELCVHKETVLKGLIGRVKLYSCSMNMYFVEPGTLVSVHT